MRVITTSIFFDKKDVDGVSYDAGNYTRNIDESLGVSFCWFKVDASRGYGSSLENSINNIKAFRGFRPVENDINLAIDAFIRNRGNNYYSPENNEVMNYELVQEVLSQKIVIERSPPTVEVFSELLKKTNSVALGAYIGSTGAVIHGIMLFVSVPAGIIVVGSAIGIANGLQNGLSSAVGRVFKIK